MALSVGLVYCLREPQISLFSNFFIKNRSHGTIHTFKNYFITVFSIFNFQFSVSAIINLIQTDPKCVTMQPWVSNSLFLPSFTVIIHISLIFIADTAHVNMWCHFSADFVRNFTALFIFWSQQSKTKLWTVHYSLIIFEHVGCHPRARVSPPFPSVSHRTVYFFFFFFYMGTGQSIWSNNCIMLQCTTNIQWFSFISLCSAINFCV